MTQTAMERTRRKDSEAKPENRQQEFPFDRGERFALIRRAVKNLPDSVACDSRGRKRAGFARNLKDLMVQIDYCTDRGKGYSQARLEVLADKCGVSISTVRRHIREAETLCWLSVEPYTGTGGQGANRYRINWTRIRVDAMKRERQKSLFEKPKDPPSQDDGAGSQDDPPPSQDGRAASHVERAFNKEVDGLTDGSEKPPSPSCGKIVDDPWELVVVDLINLGMVAAFAAVKQAKANGITVGDIRALIDHWKAHPGAWKIGALKFRIENAVPGLNPGANWPPASADFKTTEQVDAEIEQDRQEVQSLQEKRERSKQGRQWRADLEATYGETLNAMDQEQVLELADKLDPFQRRWVRRMRPNQRKITARNALLEVIAKQKLETAN